MNHTIKEQQALKGIGQHYPAPVPVSDGVTLLIVSALAAIGLFMGWVLVSALFALAS